MTQAQILDQALRDLDAARGQLDRAVTHNLRLREELEEQRGLAERRLRMIKKQTAYIGALVAAANAHGLTPAVKVTQQLNEVAGSDDGLVVVTLRKTHAGWASRAGGRAVASGQAWTEGDSTRVIDWETGQPVEGKQT